MFFLLFLSLLQAPHANCLLVCRTTVTVVNCHDQPVKGATVTIKKCDGEEVEYKTDKDGKVSSTLCKKDICDVNVTAQIEERLVKADPKNCTGTDENFTCFFKLCKDRN